MHCLNVCFWLVNQFHNIGPVLDDDGGRLIHGDVLFGDGDFVAGPE